MRPWNIIYALALAALVIGSAGCKTPRLEPGGAYAPTNSVGAVLYNDLGLALADSSYKFAYETTLGVLKFEKDNRANLFALSPKIALDVKHALDKVRAQVWEIDKRWAMARKAYRAAPTPAGLSALQTILTEITRLLPVVQSQITPVYATVETPKAP